MNPYVDVGQVEGAFIMGLGLYTSEKLKFDPNTGQKLSNGTWVSETREKDGVNGQNFINFMSWLHVRMGKCESYAE